MAQSAHDPASAAAALASAAAAPGALKSAVKAPGAGLGGLFRKFKKPKVPGVPGAPVATAAAAGGATAEPSAQPEHPGVAPILEAPPAYKAPVPPDYKTWMWPAAELEKKSKKPKILLLLLLLLLLAAAAFGAWYFFLRDDDEAASTTAAKTTAAATPLAGFVGDIDGLLKISARDRVKIKRAIIGVERNCRIAPDAAAGDVNEVTASRRQVLQKVRALKPPDAAARRVVGRFERSLTLSISANGGYSRWLADLRRSPAACNRPTANANYRAAQGINARTQTAKKAFVNAYNPLARRVGKQTWTSLQI
jgi:hypothetical protein